MSRGSPRYMFKEENSEPCLQKKKRKKIVLFKVNQITYVAGNCISLPKPLFEYTTLHFPDNILIFCKKKNYM